MTKRLAYISQGKLYYLEGDGKPQLIESAFAQDVVNRALARHEKNSWKSQGQGSGGLYSRQMLWGGEHTDPALVKVRISAVTRGSKENEIIYALDTSTVGGIFTYDVEAKKETRLFHREHLFLSDFGKHPDSADIVCSQRMANGTSCISLCRGNDVSQVTEGDSVDEAPSWDKSRDKTIIYQSAGVARNQSGFFMGVGPSSIQRLNLANGNMETVVESEEHDFILPKTDSAGTIFFIKRPYQQPYKKNYPAGKVILDAVLMPFRLAMTFFHFLNLMSMTFSKKPLTTASGPNVPTPDQKSLFLRGRLIDAEEALKKNNGDESIGLVPPDWQLVKRDRDGKEFVLAKGVLSYDIDGEDSLVYTNGSVVFRSNCDGSNRQKLAKDTVIDTVVVL